MNHWLDKTFYSVDYNVSKFFHNLAEWGGKPLNFFAKFVSIIGEWGLLFIIIGATLCLFVKTRKMGALILFSLLLSTILTNFILKPIIARPRPFENLEFYDWWVMAGKASETSYSFPSGHSTAAMAFALSVFVGSKNKKWASLIFVLPIFMASSRIYLMVHYFTDCLFGFLSATVCVVISCYIIYLLFNKTKGKLNNFINNFSIKNLFNKNKEK